MQLFLVVPVIGLALSAGAPPDYVADAKPVDRRPRNLVLGIVALICVAVVVLQPQLTPCSSPCSDSTRPVSLSRSSAWRR
jgi:hypothetical protein